ncbi:MAG: fumarylacetoacetate hydrolase family protein [Paludibacteraceae bacterium]|nr:fumarylacetoacetate hydrolase family protein [Paludibacteraceae bacterium]MBP6284300.1 fumarylacetoacetate hydrolase family protein [Paludibacteraceae bacterium]
MKILAVGWNYADHTSELNQPMPTEPVIFSKPDSSLLLGNKPFFLPHFSNEIHYETELVIRINRLGKHIAPKFASRYYSEVALGVDFTARDLQRKLKAAGQPWELCKAFDHSAAVSNFVSVAEMGDIQKLAFSLQVNNKEVQQANTSQMFFSVDEIIAYVSQFFTLKIGDLLFTGTPSGVGQVYKNDHLQGYLQGQKMFDFYVR